MNDFLKSKVVSLGWLTVVLLSAGSALGQFEDFRFWDSYDAGAQGLGTAPDGYTGAVFDGRYIYFVPFLNSVSNHGEVLRYDTLGQFGSLSSWAAYDPGANGVGTDPDGYLGGAFDGRYVYFSPYRDGVDIHGEVLRYDTQGDFANVASWAAYDPGTNGVGGDPDGYTDAIFDGRYLYFVPFHNGSFIHGEVLRYDTQGVFAGTAAWATYYPKAHGVGTDAEGYTGGVFDGRYVYFVPDHNGSEYHGEVLRYDTTANFVTAASWTTFDPGANGVGTDPDGYAGAVFDDRYIYFVPFHNGTENHGEVLRYDTQGTFTSAAAWTAYDPGANGVGTDPDGYQRGAFDGRYVYFAPVNNGTETYGEVLRLDTYGSFNAVGSWSTFDPGERCVGTDPDGYRGAVFDQRYIYFVPFHNGTEYHGEVLRYDTSGCGHPDNPFPLGDLDNDCDVDLDDFNLFSQNWMVGV